MTKISITNRRVCRFPCVELMHGLMLLHMCKGLVNIGMYVCLPLQVLPYNLTIYISHPLDVAFAATHLFFFHLYL